MLKLVGKALVLLASVALAWAGVPARGAEPAGGALPPRRAAEEARGVLERSAATRPAGYAMEQGRGRRIETSLIFVGAAPKMTPREWVVVGPMPPEHAGQRGVKAAAEPQAVEVQEQGALGRPLLLWRIRATDPLHTKLVTVQVNYSMELIPRRLVRREGGGSAAATVGLTPEERQAYTEPGTLADFGSMTLQHWLRDNGLRPREGETDLELGRRVFLHIKSKADFEYRQTMDRRASAVCTSVKSDCGGLTALFVAAMRASGVPARQLVGRWALSAEKGETLDGTAWQKEHIKAEFFATGIGWVPVDLSSAVEYDKSPAALRYFGRDDGDFVTMHIDPDLKVDSVHFGVKTLELMQGPVFWVTGRGTMQGAVATSDWEVLTPRDKRRPATAPAR